VDFAGFDLKGVGLKLRFWGIFPQGDIASN